VGEGKISEGEEVSEDCFWKQIGGRREKEIVVVCYVEIGVDGRSVIE